MSVQEKKKNVAKEFLTNYLYLKRRRELLEDEIREALERATDISVHLKEINVKTSGGDGFQGTIANAIDKCVTLASVVDELKIKEGQVLESIESLENENEKLILTMRYLKGWNWVKISMESGYADTMPFVIHGRALQKIKKWMEKNL